MNKNINKKINNQKHKKTDNKQQNIKILSKNKSNFQNKIKKTRSRPPIITIAGHVDHGKTTLLNYIKNKKNTSQEYGDITQHIQAHSINSQYGIMTFLDTPGHFIFNSIRTRSIQCTDIVVLVIAVDDGIMKQTIEVINLAKKNNVPIIIALNKIDKTNNKNKKIINELAKYDLIPEKWGGDTFFVSISAKTGEGINLLLESIKLQSEILDLKAEYNGKAKGVVIDNKIDPKQGAITSIIILNGNITLGDMCQAGTSFGKIKAIINDLGEKIKIAYPSTPVNIIGLPGLIKTGEIFTTVENKKLVKNLKQKNQHIKPTEKKYNTNNILFEIKKNKKLKMNIILKADTQGSIEVLTNTLTTLTNENIDIKLITHEIGQFNKSDIYLAITTNAYMIGFNIKNDIYTKNLAQQKGLNINYFNIIYEIIDFIKNETNKKLLSISKENVAGTAEIKKLFKYNNIKTIAGCTITNGKIKKNDNIKIFRKTKLIHTGTVTSIQIFQTTTNEVKTGMECGLNIKNYNNMQINDQIKAYTDLII